MKLTYLIADRLGYDLIKKQRNIHTSVERHVAAVLRKYKVNCVIDAGANVGHYGKLLRVEGYWGRIVSFEPVRATYKALLAATSEDDAWLIYNNALGHEDMVKSMQLYNASDLASFLHTAKFAKEVFRELAEFIRTEEVKVRRLDNLFAELTEGLSDSRVFLKMDTQGFERRILDGARESLGKLAGVQLEMSLRPLYDGESDYLELIDLLIGRGFEPVLFLPGFFSKRLGRQLQIDAIFLRSDSLE